MVRYGYIINGFGYVLSLPYFEEVRMDNSSAGHKDNISFAELALALANDYESIYVIDSEDDSYVEYHAKGEDKELVVRDSGPDFYSAVKLNCPAMVHPEDQEFFLESFKKESVTEILKNGRSFSLNYRLIKDGEPYHYFLKTIKGPDQKVIIGVRNVDEQRKRELKADHDRITYQRIADALAGRYEVIYYIDIETNEYIRYSWSDEYGKLAAIIEDTDFFKAAENYIKNYVHRDDVNYALSGIRKEAVLHKIDEGEPASLTVRQQFGDDIKYISMVIVRPENDPEHLVMGLLNVDAQIKREQQMMEESKVFNEVALALSSRYEAIYRVNTDTNEYTEYAASEKYSKLDIGNKGFDFFGDTQRNMKRDIYPEDYPMMAEAMKKENLLESLSENGKVVLNYRLLIDGKPQYVSLIIIRSQSDMEHIIVAVENVDAIKKREIEFEKAIGSALDMANRDVLTGVKNKHAYVSAETALDHEIESVDGLEFAIAVCDINGLKQVNDNQGHNAGDQFIKDGCAIICDIFSHSPVFRIGGDEFVVILKGNDYNARYELLKQFASRQRENRKNGLVTLAYGMSEYFPGADLRVQDVFERADNLMYENKRNLKGNLFETDQSDQDETCSNDGFYELFEQLVSAMVTFDKLDVPLIEDLLIKIATMLRLSKGVTRVYSNRQEEIEGGGETLRCFDLKKESHEVYSLRIVTSVMSSATMTVYMAEGEEPLSAGELQKVDLVMRTMLSFVSRNRLRDIVYQLAYYDDNGFPNLRSWLKHLTVMVSEGSCNGMTAFRYNLRHFSLINQEFGRETGDTVIKNHFEKLCEIGGEGSFMARLGGDNFLGICPEETREDVMEYLYECSVRIDDTHSVKIEASTGVFTIPGDAVIRDVGDIMGKIINAFKVAQSGGADHLIYFDDSLMIMKQQSMRIQQQFPDAMRNREFVPFYQPKIDITTGEITGAEALCRWFKDGNLIPPGDFIPVLEMTSDICKLDLYMLQRVCIDMRRWIDEGLEPIRVSVNFSRKHIMNLELADIIVSIVDKYDIPHEYIEIELTETTSNIDFRDLKRVVEQLRERGICTSIDDFGIGYSSMNIIRNIPWNTIKIDRSFLPEDGAEDNAIRHIMFSSVIGLAEKLGLEVVAEGVETGKQIDILKENGCDIAQGFYFDRPLPVEEFEKRLNDRKYQV